MAGMSDIFDCTIVDNIDATNTLVTRMKNVHLQGNLQLNDNRMIMIGDAGSADAYIKFAPENLTFFDKTVNATKTLSQLVSGGATLDTAFDAGKFIDSSTATGAVNAFSVGGPVANNKVEIYHDATNGYINSRAGDLYLNAAGGDINLGDDNLTTTGTATAAGITLATGAITSASGAISFDNENLTTTGTVNVASDNVNITLGASGATDAKMYFDGAGNLMFYDSNLGVATSLTNLAGGSLTAPVVTGDMAISDGKLTWTDATDEIAGAFTFSNITNDGIDILANSMTTANLVHIKSTTVNSGTLCLVESVDATMTTGYYFEAYNGATTVFGVKRYGEVEITGNAAADMITVSAGNLQLDNGKFEVDTTQDIGSYVKRNNAVGTGAVFEVEQTHATGGIAITVDQNATGDVDAVSIENAGTGFAVTTTAAAAGGRGYEFISATSGTSSGFLADGSTGGASWIGAAGTGLIQAQSDGALANVAASLLYLAYSGDAGGANQTGSCINVVETGAASGALSFAVGVNSASNNGMAITVGGVTKTNLTLYGATNQTASVLIADGTTNNWIGASGVGLIHAKCDGAIAHAGSSLVYSTYTGNTAAVVPLGSCGYFYENGTIAAGGFALGVKSTGGGALKVETAAIGVNNITAVGVSGQTENMVYLDGTTGANGWIGADGKAILAIACDGALAHANASCLNITNSGTGQAASLGTSLRIVDTCNAGAGSYAMYLSATDADTEALKVDNGIVVVDETVTASKGIITLALNTDVTNPPTDAELDAVTDAQNQVDGCIIFVDDGGAHTNAYLCVHDGTKWWQLTMTACA